MGEKEKEREKDRERKKQIEREKEIKKPQTSDFSRFPAEEGFNAFEVVADLFRGQRTKKKNVDRETPKMFRKEKKKVF